LEFVLEAKKLIFLTGVNSNLEGHEPAFNSFGQFLLDRGLLSLSVDSTAEKLVCIDYAPSVAKEIQKLGLSSENCTLVHMEPSVVLPANYARYRQRQFGKVITVGGISSHDSRSVHWPLLWPSASNLDKLHATERDERVVLVSGNKMSFIKGELYSLRRKAIKNLKNLDLYGTQWDSKFVSRLIIALKSFAQAALSLKLPRLSGLYLWFQDYPKSKGPVDDKLKTMAHYKYALVIENSAEYMSEKLIESLFAGCVPIYVGPDPEKYGIPKELVIRAQPSLRSIQEALLQAQGWNMNAFHAKLGAFLSSSEVRDLWDHTSVYERLLEKIQKSN
jgi:hypothetical protein